MGTQVFEPPGKVLHNGHGMQSPHVHLYGVDRLRAALNLSADTPVGRVCEEAASLIDGLPTANDYEPEEVEQPKRRGRPPGSKNRGMDDL